MADYAQFGFGYPSASQLLVDAGQATTTISAQSPLSAGSGCLNAPSLSPTGSASGVQMGALSPGALSQVSNAAATVSATGVGPVGGSGLAAAASSAAAAAAAAAASTPSSCCDNGRPIMTDPVSGQTVCSCQYDSARLALSGYSRIPSGGVSVYGTPYPSTDQNPYPSIGVDSSAFYSPLSNAYGMKESGPNSSDMNAWTSAGLQTTAGYYPYDPALAAYGYGAGYDLAARRKNATRESTATLKAWLNEHKKNPYPTKGEKIMLAIITKMTLTQVSTWFANARRRLKKENKMTWEPKNKTDDDDDAILSDDDDKTMTKEDEVRGATRGIKDSMHHVKSEHGKDMDDDDLDDDDRKPDGNILLPPGAAGHHHLSSHHPHHHSYYHHHHSMLGGGGPAGDISHNSYASAMKEELMAGMKNHHLGAVGGSADGCIPIPATKPKIWSLADTAACKTPPPMPPMNSHSHHLYHHQQQHHHHPHHPGLSAASVAAAAWMSSGGYHSPASQHQQQQQQHQQQQQQQQHLQQQQQHQQHLQQQHPSHRGSAEHDASMMSAAGSGGSDHLAAMNMSGAMNPSTGAHAAHNHPHQNMAGAINGSQMMNNFVNTQYSRYGGFLGGSQHYNNTNYNPLHQMMGPDNQQQQPSPHHHQDSPSSNHHHHNNNTMTPPASHHQPQSASSNSSAQHSQHALGFPEVQTDTPPQTPPNMKLPSVAGSLLSTAMPTTVTCMNSINSNNNNSINNNNNNNSSSTASNDNNNLNCNSSSASSSSTSSSSDFVGNFRIQQQHHHHQHHLNNHHHQDHNPHHNHHHLTADSPNKSSKDYAEMMRGSPHNHTSNAMTDDAAFKPFFRRSLSGSGFVSAL